MGRDSEREMWSGGRLSGDVLKDCTAVRFGKGGFLQKSCWHSGHSKMTGDVRQSGSNPTFLTDQTCTQLFFFGT